MYIHQEIENEFFSAGSSKLGDDFIENNADVMWVNEDMNPMVYVPSYMIWVAQNKEKNGNLICDYTINALAEYGRAKDCKNSNLNFKHLCNNNQKKVVLRFLEWCKNNLEFIDTDQIERSIMNWK